MIRNGIVGAGSCEPGARFLANNIAVDSAGLNKKFPPPSHCDRANTNLNFMNTIEDRILRSRPRRLMPDTSQPTGLC